MSNQQAILQGFQQLNAQLVQEEQQRPPLAPEHGPQQNAEQQLQRLAFGFSFYLKPRLSELIQWAQRSRETSNFTYDLTDLNLAQLAGWVSMISNCTLQQANQWIQELRQDDALRQHLNTLTANSNSAITADLNMGYGRRLGWYALVRALKPQTVVETGVDKGLGSCVLSCVAAQSSRRAPRPVFRQPILIRRQVVVQGPTEKRRNSLRRFHRKSPTA